MIPDETMAEAKALEAAAGQNAHFCIFCVSHNRPSQFVPGDPCVALLLDLAVTAAAAKRPLPKNAPKEGLLFAHVLCYLVRGTCACGKHPGGAPSLPPHGIKGLTFYGDPPADQNVLRAVHRMFSINKPADVPGDMRTIAVETRRISSKCPDENTKPWIDDAEGHWKKTKD